MLITTNCIYLDGYHYCNNEHIPLISGKRRCRLMFDGDEKLYCTKQAWVENDAKCEYQEYEKN